MRAAAAALAIAQPQNGLIDNVTGYTLDDQGQLRRFNGLLIDASGKVLQLLNPGDKPAGPLSFPPRWLAARSSSPASPTPMAISWRSASRRCAST